MVALRRDDAALEIDEDEGGKEVRHGSGHCQASVRMWLKLTAAHPSRVAAT